MRAMTSSDFERAAEQDRAAVEARLRDVLDARAAHHGRMREALGYALLGAGKRVRPLLCLWTHDAFAPLAAADARDAALDAACALECAHTYSLVHDDLPCMDDDDLRRGKPSLHRRFDEATAVLAGDALLSLSFEILSGLEPVRVAAPVALEALGIHSAAVGSGGLITGQALDLEATEATAGPAGVARVERIHEFKTARLIAAAMEIGVLLGEKPSLAATRTRVRAAGLLAGSAFQIVDDLLDLDSDAKTLGKTPRKDVKHGKLTYPAVAGRAAASAAAEDRIARALACLPEAAGTPLAALLAYVAERRC
jgi:geranylgeranyl pyrophosphate synthase